MVDRFMGLEGGRREPNPGLYTKLHPALPWVSSTVIGLLFLPRSLGVSLFPASGQNNGRRPCSDKKQYFYLLSQTRK